MLRYAPHAIGVFRSRGRSDRFLPHPAGGGAPVVARLRHDPGRPRCAGAQSPAVSVRSHHHRRGGLEPCAHRSLRPPAAAGQARLSRAYLHEHGVRGPGADPAARFGEPRDARRGARAGRRSLYDLEDVETTLRLLQPIAYDTPRELLPGVTVQVRDAGHILGSSSVELWVSEGGEQRKLVFSGDLGQYDTPILQDPYRVRIRGSRAHGEHLRQSPASRPRRHRARARRHPRAGAARRRQRHRAGVRHRPQPGAALSTGEALR